jgi:dihydroflavonol-4-reductase
LVIYDILITIILRVEYMEEKLCVLTGASGHVGYALLKELEAAGERVRIVIRKDSGIFSSVKCEKAYGDVCDRESLEKAFEGADIVYHLAGIIDVNTGNEDLIYKVNVEGTKNVVAACKKCGVRRLVYASSVDAFPPLPGNALMTEIESFNPDILDGTYAKTKAIATQYVLDSTGGGFEAVVVHPGACIGPYDFKTSNIGEMVRMFMRGRFPVTMDFGAYSFVDVRDVAKGMYAAAQKAESKECFILTGQSITVDKLIHILAKKCSIKAPRFVLKKWMADAAAPFAEIYYKAAKKTPLFTRYSIRKLVSNCNFSYEKAQKELGFNPMSAEESLNDMVDWIKNFEVNK